MSPEAVREELTEVFLNPGDFAFGGADCRIRTILGSCVAVTFWHPGRRLGAMCHYLLPGRGQNQDDRDLGKYADEVLPLIAARFMEQNLPPAAFQVKMFGGSNMFPGLTLGESLSIGAKNIQTGLVLLTEQGFNITNYDLAGGTNRTVLFDVSSGEVWVRQGQGGAGRRGLAPTDRNR